MPNPAAVAAAHARAIALAGQPVIFQRAIGFGPSATTISAAVNAVVRKVTVDASAVSRDGYSASKPGAVTESDREVLAMKTDLTAAGFPLPVVKGDRIQIVETSDWLQVEEVDGAKRYLGGCVELTAKGIA